MTDDEIIEMAKQLYGGDLTDEQLRNHKTITFARLIMEKQKEIDANVCLGMDGMAGDYGEDFADAIRSQP